MENLLNNENKLDKSGLNKDNFDLTVSMKDDFYQFANGGWMKQNPLPQEMARFGVFDKVYEQSLEQRKELISSLCDNPDSAVKDTDAQKIKDIYELGMDIERLNKEGATPLLPSIGKIEKLNLKDLEKAIAWLHLGITSTFFSTGVGPDQRDSSHYLMNISYSGLGLGDRDYYIETTPDSRRYMEAYEVYIKRLMELVGYDKESQERIWSNVIEIETKMAEHQKTKEELRDPNAIFNLMSIDEFKKRYTFLNWDTYFGEFGIDSFAEINVIDPNYLDFINDYIGTLSERQIKDLFIYALIADSAGVLSEDFSDATFQMFGRVMNGTEEQKPRWKKIMGIVNSMFGEVVGKLYVEKYFPVENKEYMLNLVENLRKALHDHISQLSWMSDETKKRAHEKLSALKIKIGYPDKWKDYSGIKIDPNKSFQENVYNASVWIVKDNYQKLFKPVDKNEWFMTPQTVNAYYSPVSNEICFPAGILQPPFFDISADDAINYGRIGVVIGHEMTHGFDDRGRHYDKDGNLIDWWTKEDSGNFNCLAEALARQFDNIEIRPGLKANGKFTLGENIADQGGLRIAITAYKEAMKGKVEKQIDGYSPLQRFFLAYANVWAENLRPETVPVRVKSDSHSLGKNRVNDTLKNLDIFFDTFNITEKDGMYRPSEERIIIW